jgi:membrane protein implicated in regulation of membrane protease activity
LDSLGAVATLFEAKVRPSALRREWYISSLSSTGPQHRMNLEFLSGLLLGIAALAAVAYIAKETIAVRLRRRIRIDDLVQACRRLVRGFAVHGDAKPVNAQLIASLGKVVAHTADEARPMRVRVGLELWPARSHAPEPARLPVGTPIKVTGVAGPILIVESSAPEQG